MLENLGLGIVLTMEDNFTPQANKAMKTMTQFEKQAEEMSDNVRKAMNNLQNIMLSGFSLDTIGGDFQNVGKSILGVFTKIAGKVTSVNAQFQTLQAQLLTSFKGNAQEAKKAFDWTRDFASDTPFDTKGLTDSFVKMMSNGMDIRKMFKATTGDVKTLAEAMGDLATRNMYGSTGGVEGIGIGLQNAWSGNARSLWDRFNFSKAEMDKMMQHAGKDVDKFMQEFIELSQRLAPNAMNNMNGTWNQVMSNMSETWDNFVYDLGQTGIFGQMSNTLSYVQMQMQSVFGDKSALSSFGELLSALWAPVDKIVKGLTNMAVKIIEFSKEHPKITKYIATFTALLGVGLVLTGTIMKLTGGFLVLGASLASAYLNFKLIKQLNMAGDFNFMWASASRATRSIGVFSLVFLGLALAMKSNFMGIGDKGREAFTNIKLAWQSSEVVLDRGVGALDVLDRKFDKLTERFVKFRLMGTILGNTLFGKMDGSNIVYTEKELENLRAHGMLPMAQSFAIIKGRATAFFKGLQEGLGSAFVMVRNFVEITLKPMKVIFDVIEQKLSPIATSLKTMFGFSGDTGMDADTANNQIDKFKELGEKAGILLGVLLGFKVIKTIAPILMSPFKLLTGAISGSMGALGKFKKSMGGVGLNLGASHNSRKQKASDKFNNYLNEYQDLPTLGQSGINGYAKVNKAPNRFSQVLNKTQSGVNQDNLFTKTRGGLAQKLFGNKYFEEKSDGSMKSVGSWGGRLNADRDDQQMILGLQRFVSRGGVVNRPTLDDFGGDVEAYRRTVNNHLPKVDPFVGNGASVLKGMDSDDVFKGRVKDAYTDAQTGKDWKNRYKSAGLDGRKMSKDAKKNFDMQYIANTPNVKALNEERKVRNMGLFASNKQSKLSQLMFGKKMYSLEQGEDGTQSRRVVARTGGLFRNQADDMVYNPEKTLGERFRGSRLGIGLGYAKNGIGRGFSSIKKGLGLGVSSAKRGFGSTKLGGFINNQKARLNIGNDTNKTGFFTRMFGKEVQDEHGGIIRKKGSIRNGLGKAGGFFKGAGKVGKGVLGGAGKLLGGAGKLAMGALPLAMGALSAGKLGFDLIKQKGGGDFSEGLNMLKTDIAKIDLSKIWTNFKKTAKESFTVIKEIAGTIFSELKESLPAILGDAWEGIKGMAGLAWGWIKENGVGMIGGLVDWLIADGLPMMFKALKGIGTWIITDLFPFVWKVLKDIVPKIAKGILDFLVTGLSSLGDTLGGILISGLTSVLRFLLPKSMEDTVLSLLGLPTHHGGLYMSDNEHMALIRKDETVLPPTMSRKLDTAIESMDNTPVAHRSVTRDKSTATQDHSVNIDKVEVIVKADKLSRAEARAQAKMILEEIKGMGKEKLIRQYI